MDDDQDVYQLHDPDLPPEALEDHMQPPAESILVHCLHCSQEYQSDQIIWVPRADESTDKHRLPGMWCCPVDGCGGAGFTCDIWPVDPDYVDPKTGETYWSDDPPMVEGHESDCECAECEMARDEQEAEYEREAEEYKRKVASGEIKPPQVTDEEMPF